MESIHSLRFESSAVRVHDAFRSEKKKIIVAYYVDLLCCVCEYNFNHQKPGIFQTFCSHRRTQTHSAMMKMMTADFATKKKKLMNEAKCSDSLTSK